MARRMAEAAATIPHFYLRSRADVTEVLAARAAAAGDSPPPSLTDAVVRACALALRRHPEVNASFLDGEIELYSRINVGVAMAIPDGLVVPVIHDADAKTVAEIGRLQRLLLERARAGRLTRGDIEHGTFTVSNLGMFGIESFDPIVNPPEAAILAVGAVRTEGAREMLMLTLGCDHRVLTGAEGATFLGTLRDVLSDPSQVLDAPGQDCHIR